jgi:hypothetical protein
VSIPDRLFRLSKAYMNQVRDRIDAELSDRESAMRELDGGREPQRPAASGEPGDELMRRAEAKIAAARREADARRETAPASASAPVAATDATPAEASAYRILGVPVGADLSTVQAAYENLAARCDPRRFPDGSAEEKDAQMILGKVNTAYDTLRKRLDPTENRFGKLELE